jgi:hypothetical protein
LRCEQEEDHIGMLLDFARQAKALPQAKDYEHVEREVRGLRGYLCRTEEAGLIGLVILGVLENTSDVFIPILADLGRRCGVRNFTYTQKHGEADAEHSQAFVDALKAEIAMGYGCLTPHGEPRMRVREVARETVILLKKIFSVA